MVERRGLDSGMAGVQLPGMEIDDGRLAGGVRVPNPPSRQPVRKHAKVSPAADRQVLSQDPNRGHGKFPKTPSDLIRMSRRIRDAVNVMDYREDARIVNESEGLQDFDGPQRALRYRERGGPESQDFRACDPLDDVQRSPEVLGKLLWGLLVDDLMGIPVAADIMPGGLDFLDDAGRLLGDPSQDEEGGLDLVSGQQLENLQGAVVDPPLVTAPILATDYRLKSLDMVIVLDIDRKRVKDLIGPVRVRAGVRQRNRLGLSGSGRAIHGHCSASLRDRERMAYPRAGVANRPIGANSVGVGLKLNFCCS
jgi:hypothetical protein